MDASNNFSVHANRHVDGATESAKGLKRNEKIGVVRDYEQNAEDVAQIVLAVVNGVGNNEHKRAPETVV